MTDNEKLTREDLIALCERAVVDVGKWSDPSDAQVGAAMHAVERYYASQGITSVSESVDFQAMRAALRDAGGVR